MSNVYEHPTLAINKGIKAAEAQGSLLDVVLAIEECWKSDLDPKKLEEALSKCRSLAVDPKSASRFYRLLCKVNPIWKVPATYTDADLRGLESQLADAIQNAKRQDAKISDNVADMLRESLVASGTLDHLRREYEAATFQLFERERYHHFWPAVEIADILEGIFPPSDDPGRVIGSYLRAMFDGPDPEDENLGIFFQTASPKHANAILSVAGQVAGVICRSESITQGEKNALDALILGEAFGGCIDDPTEGRLAALRLAKAAVSVSNQYLFTALAKEAVTAEYLDVDERTEQDMLVARVLMVCFFVGTCPGFDRRQVDALCQEVELRRNHDAVGALSEFLVTEGAIWRLAIEKLKARDFSKSDRRPRLPPQLLFSFLSWRNVAIAEIANHEAWFCDAVLPKHMIAADRYSVSSLAGRAYFLWDDAVEPAVIHWTALRAADTKCWSVPTLIAFIQSHTFYESYRGLFVNEDHGLGEFEREIVRRCEQSGLPVLAAAFASFFVFDHARRFGQLPETLKWCELIKAGFDTRIRHIVCRSVAYAAQLVNMRGNELNALALLDLLPLDAEPVAQLSRHIGSTATASEYQGAMEGIRQILNGVDPHSVLDDEPLRQWVDAYRIEAMIRSHVGAPGLVSWIGPGHGYHAAMEATLRSCLSKVYFDGAYRAWKDSIGESQEWRSRPSWDHLLKLLRDGKRSAQVTEMLDEITSLHHHPQIISRLEHLNQQFRTKTAHGKNFSQKDMGTVLDILFGSDSLFRAVVLNLRPRN